MNEKTIAIANYFIEKTQKHNKKALSFNDMIFLTIRKLNKYIYISEIFWMLHNKGKTLIEENYYAWPSGPCIPSLYDNYDFDLKEIKTSYILSKEEIDVLDKVFEFGYDRDCLDIEDYCKIKDGPWDIIYDELDENHLQKISKDYMYKFYKKIIDYMTII